MKIFCSDKLKDYALSTILSACRHKKKDDGLYFYDWLEEYKDVKNWNYLCKIDGEVNLWKNMILLE